MTSNTFRLGLTRDLLTPAGAPSFGAGALEVLALATTQDAITVEVPEPVVDGLELVEVHHQQAEPPTRSGTPGDLPLEVLPR